MLGQSLTTTSREDVGALTEYGTPDLKPHISDPDSDGIPESNGLTDPVPVRLRLSQKREKKIMFEEFSVGLEASPQGWH